MRNSFTMLGKCLILLLISIISMGCVKSASKEYEKQHGKPQWQTGETVVKSTPAPVAIDETTEELTEQLNLLEEQIYDAIDGIEEMTLEEIGLEITKGLNSLFGESTESE